MDGDLSRETLALLAVPVAFGLGCLVLGGAAWVLAALTGRPRAAAAVAGCAVALALAVTLARPHYFPPAGWHPRQVWDAVVLGDPSLAQRRQRLNVLMLVPFGYAATLAVGRPLLVTAGAGALSLAIEYVQAATGRGTFETADLLHNTGGALAAALVAWGVLRVRRRSPRGAVSRGRAAAPARAR